LLIGYKQQKRRKNANDSLLFFSLPIISHETFFRSQIVFFNIDQMCSLFCSFHHQLFLSFFTNVFDFLFFFARTKIDVRRSSFNWLY
jgi:hypothetical protein